jgi:hypothetical protein
MPGLLRELRTARQNTAKDTGLLEGDAIDA